MLLVASPVLQSCIDHYVAVDVSVHFVVKSLSYVGLVSYS